MATRYNINDFALANPAYVGATVSFWTVSGGVKTATLATLYAAATGSTTLTNPRALDSDGKFSVPVYVEVATVATVSGLTVADHDTGIMGLTEAAASASAAAAAASETAAAASAAAALVSENNVASAAFGTVSETFNGGGSAFVIAYDAGTLSNIEVFISGVHQVPTTDFTYNNATRTVTTTSTTPSGTGNVLVQYARLRTSAFFTPGIIDNATAKALTLSGSGANSVTIANSATNPTIGTSAGRLALSSAGAAAAVQVQSATSGATYILANNAATGGLAYLSAAGETNTTLGLSSAGTGEVRLMTNDRATTQIVVTHTASAACYLTLTGAVASGFPTIGVGGETPSGLVISGNIIALYGQGAEQVRITGIASANRFITLTGSNGGNPTIGTNAGDLAIASATGFLRNTASVSSIIYSIGTTGSGAFVAQGAAGQAAAYQMIVNGAETARIVSSSNGMGLSTGPSATVQVSIAHTASADRYITLTGSNGGNPTIGTSAGGLAVSADLVGAGFLQAKAATATPAGGTPAIYIGASAHSIGFGSGIPTYSALKGSLYLRSDGSTTNNRMYVNTDGAATWTAVTTAA